MKVCMITTSFPRWKDDSQGTFVWQLARSVASCGVQVLVVAMHSPGARTFECTEGIEIIRPRYWLPESWEMLRKSGGGLPVTWRQYPLARIQILPFFLVHMLTVTRFARSCDLIHAHWTLSAAAACLGRPFHQRRIIVTVQGSDIFQITVSPVGAWLTREILSRCDATVALSKALQAKVLQLGVEPGAVHIVPNGVNINQFTPSREVDRDHLLLYVGSLIQRKGVKYLIQAMPDIGLSFPDYRLVIVGDGPEKPFLQQLTRELGVDGKVYFAGEQPQSEVVKWMQKAKILILPSLEEGMGVVLVEALACGTPVVASNVDGIRDVVTPDVGALVPPGDPKAISDGIAKILDPATWTRASQNARQRAETYYRWDRIAEQYIELYRQVLKQTR